MSAKREQTTRSADHREESPDTDAERRAKVPDSAAQASASAGEAIDSIDEVLEEFDDLTLEMLGYEKDAVVDRAEVDEAVARLVRDFRQKGGQ